MDNRTKIIILLVLAEIGTYIIGIIINNITLNQTVTALSLVLMITCFILDTKSKKASLWFDRESFFKK